MKTTEEKVIGIIQSIKKEINYPITKKMSLTEDLLLDSLDMNMLLDSVESNFSCKIDMIEFEKIKTVGNIIDTLETRTH
jgi:acyl carrier protein